MSLHERSSVSEQLLVIRKNLIGQGTTEMHYRHSRTSLPRPSPTFDEPQLAMYELLRSLIRNQLKLPFQVIKQTIKRPMIEMSVRRHLQRDLQVAVQDMRNVCGLVRQRLLLEGFLQLKQAHNRRIRIEGAYYSIENVAKLNMAMLFAQNSFKSFLKWQGFSKLFQHFRGMKLSKITLSKIEVVSGDLTAKEFQDFNPFLAERGREIEAINSYIIDRSSEHGPEAVRQEDSQELRDEVREIGYRQGSEQQQSIERHFFAREAHSKQRHVFTRQKHASLTEKFFRTQEQNSAPRISEFIQQSTEKRQSKRTAGAYVPKQLRDSEELEQRVLMTQRKVVQRQGQQHLFVVRDYRTKATPPSDYIKLPLASQEVKIVQIDTGRKHGSSRRRVYRAQAEVEREICQNCRFCIQTRERQEIMLSLRAKLELLQTAPSTN